MSQKRQITIDSHNKYLSLGNSLTKEPIDLFNYPQFGMFLVIPIKILLFR